MTAYRVEAAECINELKGAWKWRTDLVPRYIYKAHLIIRVRQHPLTTMLGGVIVLFFIWLSVLCLQAHLHA